MYLFTKRTRNVIKGIWVVVASLVMVSMVLTYSGFTSLSNTPQTQPIEVSPEDLVVSTTTTSGALSTSSPAVQNPPQEEQNTTPPTPELNFGL